MQPKILLVDDREDNLLSLQVILEPQGYEFVTANSGRQALKILLTEFDFALILMDVKMPNLNGFETANLIYDREKLKHIPIIFITANNYGDENMFKGYQLGAIDFILKPINPEILRAKVGVLIDLYKKNRLLVEQEQKLMEVNRVLEIEINERKAAEEKVQQVNRKLLENLAQLETANNDLDRFAFMASHDLQEPLRKIRIFSLMLAEKNKDFLPDDNAMISRIDKTAERMQTLIAGILAFSRVSTEKTIFEECDLHALLNEIVSDRDEELKEKEATVLIESIPCLFVSPMLMRLLFQNLINNALKYRRKNVDTVIRISSKICKARNDGVTENPVNNYCRISVEDNGIGFDQKYSEQIFGMLKKLHANNEYEGTGIGLALCKKIAEIHNGTISATSRENEGSTFIVSLPLNHDDCPEPGAKQNSEG